MIQNNVRIIKSIERVRILAQSNLTEALNGLHWRVATSAIACFNGVHPARLCKSGYVAIKFSID
ncbi:hypothetical protein HanIR_Chr09g0427281 [Helianthus annuus]|nr:hypothetical protein HanIR_Chr09g0427281 [Helianthus annuus]